MAEKLMVCPPSSVLEIPVGCDHYRYGKQRLDDVVLHESHCPVLLIGEPLAGRGGPADSKVQGASDGKIATACPGPFRQVMPLPGMYLKSWRARWDSNPRLPD